MEFVIFTRRTVFNHRQIGLVYSAVAEKFVHAGKRLTCAGKDHKSAYGTVKAVSHTRKTRPGFAYFSLMYAYIVSKRAVARLVALDYLAPPLCLTMIMWLSS